MSIILAGISGLIAYRITFSEFRGVLPYLLGLGIIAFFVSISPFILEALIVAGIGSYIIAKFFLGKPKEKATQLALYSAGIYLILPLVLAISFFAGIKAMVGL